MPARPPTTCLTKRTCDVPACGRKHYGRGWCRAHYLRMRIHGTLELPARTKPPTPCTVEDCTAKAVAKRLCSWHYQQTRDTRQPVCSVAGCAAPQRAGGLCPNHYAYQRRHGAPSPQYACQGCGGMFPGRANTLHCTGCKPSPNVYAQKRKARLAANNVGMTDIDQAESAEYRAILRGDPCAYCGAPSTAIDHILPTVEGGSDRWENLAPVCKGCNSRKRTRSVLTVLLSRMAP